MVEGAHSRRARAEQWVEKFARVYTRGDRARGRDLRLPPMLFGAAWGDWFYRALAPGDRLPLRARDLDPGEHRGGARRLGPAWGADQRRHLRRAARRPQGHGVRQDRHVELGAPDRGRGRAVRRPQRGGADRARRRLEARSTHPLAKAILEHAEARKIEIAPAESVQVLQGRACRPFAGRDLLARLTAISWSAARRPARWSSAPRRSSGPGTRSW